jgi:hypothetical protein
VKFDCLDFGIKSAAAHLQFGQLMMSPHQQRRSSRSLKEL